MSIPKGKKIAIVFLIAVLVFVLYLFNALLSIAYYSNFSIEEDIGSCKNNEAVTGRLKWPDSKRVIWPRENVQFQAFLRVFLEFSLFWFPTSSQRSELHARKRTPLWGFAKWTASKKKQVEKEIKFEFDRDAEMAQRQLRQMEAELNRLFQWKPKTKTSVSAKIPKKTKAELRKEALADMPDLFDF